MTVRTLTIADLCLSPHNARTDPRATGDSPAMQASILKLGLILPLAVHPMLGSKKFGVFDGGRRYRAIKALVQRQALPSDWPIDVSIRQGDSEAELLEISTAAGLLGQQLRSHEVMAALAKAVRRGATEEEIVEITGQEPLWVRRHLRLGNLVQPVFDAFVGEEITEDQAKAFAAVEDHALQLRAWEQLQLRPAYERGPDRIRKLLNVGDAEQAKLLRFVGETAYRDAGGRYELDLFAELAETRGLVSDPGILVELVEAKLTEAKERLRDRAGRELRFTAEYPRHSNYGGVDQELEVRPELAPIADDDVERAEFLEEELVELEHQAGKLARDGGSIDEMDAVQAERAAHGAELVSIDDRRPVRLPAGDIYASLKIEDSGQLEVRWWWESRKAKRAAQEAAQPQRTASAGPIAVPVAQPHTTATVVPQKASPKLGGSALVQHLSPGARERADFAAKEQAGITREGVQILRTVRRQMMRAMLVRNEKGRAVGHDYLLWLLLRRQLVMSEHVDALGGRGLGRDDDVIPIATITAAMEQEKAMPAAGIWDGAIAELRKHPAIAEADVVVAFRAFRSAPDSFKQLTAAAVAAMTLARSMNADGYLIPLHNELAHQAGYGFEPSLRGLWEPTAAFVELLPKAHRLALAEPHVDRMAFRTWGNLKSSELVGQVTRALLRAKTFVHPMLGFAPTGAIAPQPALQDAAE